MASGVRNLRAMFENKDQATSPPDRGRSPAGSIGGGSNGTSPRPLSKVRTSFVAVERSGQLGSQLGLKRETSGEPSMAKRRTSFSIDEEDHPVETAERKNSIATELEVRKNSKAIQETIPEVAIQTPSEEPDKQLGGGRKGPTKDGAERVDLKKTAASSAASNGQIHDSSKPVVAAKSVEKAPTSKTTTRPTPIHTAKTSAAAKASPKTAKSPAIPKTPTTPRGRPKESTHPPEKKVEKKASKASLVTSHTSKPQSKHPTTTAHGSTPKKRIQASPPQTGFVKPKPRSPTRPVKLPASLTAHTASSGSKTAAAPPHATAGRQSLSRASGNYHVTNTLQAHQALSRSPSRASTVAAPKSTLTRKPSNLNKTGSGRPSLGPPPSSTLKKQPSRHSLPHSAPADEGFLARMMRPTTSSASKTAEKVTTPPKTAHLAKRPLTRDGHPKHESPKPAAPKMGKLVAKPVAKEAKPVTPSSAPEHIKEAPKAVIQEAAAAPRDEIPAVPDVSAVPEISAVPDIPEVHAQVAEDPVKEVEDVKATETQLAASEEPAPVVLEKDPERESTLEKAAPIEEHIPATQEEHVESVPATIEESVTPEATEQVPQKTEDVDLAKEAIEESQSEHVAEKTIEVEIPKEVEAREDPEDIKAREEIAKLNAEVLKGSLGAPSDADVADVAEEVETK